MIKKIMKDYLLVLKQALIDFLNLWLSASMILHFPHKQKKNKIFSLWFFPKLDKIIPISFIKKKKSTGKKSLKCQFDMNGFCKKVMPNLCSKMSNIFNEDQITALMYFLENSLSLSKAPIYWKLKWTARSSDQTA